MSEIDKVFGRKYKYQTGTQKALNLALGSKVYEFETKDLLKRFDRLTEDEARTIKRQINTLRREIKKEPKRRKENMEDIKMLRQEWRKARRKARRDKREARKSLR